MPILPQPVGFALNPRELPRMECAEADASCVIVESCGSPGFKRTSKNPLRFHMGMGQNPVPPVNIPISTKIGSKMGGAPKTPKMGSPTRF